MDSGHFAEGVVDWAVGGGHGSHKLTLVSVHGVVGPGPGPAHVHDVET